MASRLDVAMRGERERGKQKKGKREEEKKKERAKRVRPKWQGYKGTKAGGREAHEMEKFRVG